MADRFEVVRETLRQTGEAVDLTARRLGDAADTLRYEMARLDGCWGGDEPGRAFGENYAPKGRDMMERLAELVAALERVPTGLEEMAANYERAESASAIPGID